MANIIEMPKLSDTMTVGTLVKWLKKEGDAVQTGDMLAEVETDKATMELESFFDGTLLKIFADAGAQVWDAGSLQVGDRIQYWGGWDTIAKVNAKSIRLASRAGRLPFDQIKTVRASDGRDVRLVDGDNLVDMLPAGDGVMLARDFGGAI